MIVAGDQQLLKQINRMALVRHLCGAPGLSRAALAEAVGLTKSTVSLLVRELLDEGWLSESELVATGALGRRATPLRLDTGRLALLGADLGIGGARVVATDLLGTVLAERALPYADLADPGACVGLIADALVALAAPDGPLAGRAMLGLGIGVPGVVDDATGVLRYAPHLGWRDVDVLGRLRARFAATALAGLPLFIQNEANVAALAELEFAGQVGADPLIYLSIGYGVGAGIVVNGRLLTGLYGFAGEVGHTILQQGGPPCSCGRRGCADALIGMRAVTDQVYGKPGKAGGSGDSGPERLERLFAQAEAGEADARRAVEAAGRHMGVLLNNLWVAFDPMCIVVGGAALRLGERFLAPGREVLRDYAEATQLPAPTIRTPHFGANAIAIGGAAMARHHLMRPFGGQGAGAMRANPARL
ncbi:ROK family transcriptional regulator [Burkholderia sp. LMU1-1-1.1]|uniref:ROK family transcriptional regulator n=1 Tax=Burkholderia sp. LMU1-1-1.1 TaxID=3135266 RepID=UPI003429F3D1